MTDKTDTSLGGAYALASVDDQKRLYAAWAESYDEDLRRRYDYVYAETIADLYLAAGGGGPALDIGCGTGLIGAALATRGMAGPVDGADLSPEMLAAARAKGVYRTLIEADLTAAQPFAPGAYAGLLSAGTFTIGALGPEALTPVIAAAAPGAICVIGIHEAVFEARGFDAALADEAAAGAIAAPSCERHPIYGPAASHENANDRFVAAIFTRAGPC